MNLGAALSGLRIVYLAGPGPLPFAMMLLGDLGADVVRIDRAGGPPDLTGLASEDDPRSRGHRGIGLNLKDEHALTIARALIGGADVFGEGMRPGAAERMGLGPEELTGINPRLIYARMTGWGQTGPLAARAGHDINYLAVAGALHPIGPSDQPPTVPLNLVADFGGGGTYFALGVLAALLQRVATGRGQVVDVAMIDGVASLTALLHGLQAQGLWQEQRGTNLLDGGAPYYRTYRTADDRFVAVGALEPQFFEQLLAGVGLEPAQWPQHDRTRWPRLAERLTEIFAGADRAHWLERFAGTDACVSPVLTPTEAADDPQARSRSTFVDWDGLIQPAPAPRLADSPPQPRARSGWCSHTRPLLADLGYSAEEIDHLVADGVVADGVVA